MAECQKMEAEKAAELVFEAPKPENTNGNERVIKVDSNLWMKEGEIFTVRSLANAFGIDRTSAWKKIKKLVNKGLLKKVGKQKLGSNRKAPAYMVVKGDKKKLEAKPDKAKKQKANKAKPKNKPAPVDKKKREKPQQEEYTKTAKELLKEAEEYERKRKEEQDKQTEPKNDEGYELMLNGELATDTGEVKASFALAVQVDADAANSNFVKNLLWQMFNKY